jgi:hypothetical protein
MAGGTMWKNQDGRLVLLSRYTNFSKNQHLNKNCPENKEAAVLMAGGTMWKNQDGRLVLLSRYTNFSKNQHLNKNCPENN